MALTIRARADLALIEIIEDKAVPLAQRLKAIAELTKRQAKPSGNKPGPKTGQTPVNIGPSNVLGTR
jgi:hypothetical protein